MVIRLVCSFLYCDTSLASGPENALFFLSVKGVWLNLLGLGLKFSFFSAAAYISYFLFKETYGEEKV